jgi:membrane-associated HD superfamily phosphohydrolase
MKNFGNSFSRFNESVVKNMIDLNTDAINEILNSEIEMIENEISKNEISNPKKDIDIEIEKSLKYDNILKDFLSKNESPKNETSKIEIPKIEVLRNIIVSNTIVMLRDREPYVYIEMSPSNSRRIYTGVDIMSNIGKYFNFHDRVLLITSYF